VGDPLLYIATADPFAAPGMVATTNDVELFGGVFADRSFGNVAKFWNAEYLNDYMIGGIYGHDFLALGAGFVVGGVVGTAVRFGDDEESG
jgi:hypothetical protein